MQCSEEGSRLKEGGMRMEKITFIIAALVFVLALGTAYAKDGAGV